MKEKKYSCQCCGYVTLEYKPPGGYDTCPICFWEDAGGSDPDEICGANGLSFREAQKNFKEFGSAKKRSLEFVRKPTETDEYEGPLDVSDIKRMPIDEMIRIFKVCEIPLEKIFHLYKSKYPVKNSKFRFSNEQLEKYITSEELLMYFVLENYKDTQDMLSQDTFFERKLMGLTDEQVEEEKQHIIDKFIKNAEEDIKKER